MSEPHAGRSDPDFPRDPEQARTDLELTRRELGDTVEELERRLNVPARAKERVDGAAHAMHDHVPPSVMNQAEHAAALVGRNPKPYLAAGTGVVVLLIAAKLLRRARTKHGS